MKSIEVIIHMDTYMHITCVTQYTYSPPLPYTPHTPHAYTTLDYRTHYLLTSKSPVGWVILHQSLLDKRMSVSGLVLEVLAALVVAPLEVQEVGRDLHIHL